MPRPRRNMPNEKSKDFFGSLKRLILNLKPWKILLTISIILAIFSAVVALVTPDLLSNLTDKITIGISPKNEKLKEIYSDITNHFTLESIASKMDKIILSDTISNEDKINFQQILLEMKTIENKEEILSILPKIPDSILTNLFEELEIDSTKITVEDQIALFHLLKDIDSKNVLEKMDKLPDSIYNLVKPSIDLNQVRNLAIFIGMLYLISAICHYIENFSMTTISNKFAKSLRTSISNKINVLPLKYFDSHETGDVLSRVTNDVDMIAQNLNNSLATLVTSITLFLGSIFMMFTTNGLLAITAIFSSLIGFVFMSVILGKSQKYFIRRQEELGNMNGYIEEMYSGHNIVKVYNGKNEAIQKFEELNKKLFEANCKSAFLSGLMMPIMNFVGNLGYVAVCLVGALLVQKNVITFGVIIAFIIYVRLFTNPLTQIAQAMTSLQSTAAAGERVFEFLDESEMTNESHLKNILNKEEVKGNIEFKNVRFGYDKDRTIIKDFSVKVKPGEKIAIVGPTGAGKTTMVNLLMKFYEISEGDILIDNVSIKELTRENIHELFCMVLQDTWLFDGTVKENIRFNQKNIDDEEIWNACKVVGIDHFIKTLPGGLNAMIGDNDTVSSGQKQLFTIVRGMLKHAPFLILDEATSNVDTRTEELVAKAMDTLTKGKTSFIIAHRLSTIKNADLILVMNEGNIIETGTHEELMQQKGFYEKLYNSQFEKMI